MFMGEREGRGKMLDAMPVVRVKATTGTLRAITESPVLRPQGELLAGLRALAGEAAQLDPRGHEDDDGGLRRLAAGLRRHLIGASALLGELQQIDDLGYEPQWVDEIDDGASFDEADLGGAMVLSPPRLANVCFAGALELTRVLRELDSAHEISDMLVAAETARRKLLRAARAVLDAADDVVDDEPAWRHEGSDLGAALVVRRLYSRFRRSLRRAAGDDAEAVLGAVRYAAGALATLVTSPAYAEARISDRTLLRRLHARTLGWAREDRGVTSGRQLLDDVWTTADLLRGINQRQELRAHDAAASVVAMQGPGDSPDRWRTALDALVGLDDELDGLVERALEPCDPRLVADAIRARLIQLR